jgi:hypothetical protein
MVEAPNAFNDIVGRFLAEVTGAAVADEGPEAEAAASA